MHANIYVYSLPLQGSYISDHQCEHTVCTRKSVRPPHTYNIFYLFK